MNRFTFRAFSFFVLNFCFIALVACNNNPADRDTAQNTIGQSLTLNYNSGELAVIGVEDAMDELQDATLDDSMRFHDDFFRGHHFRHGGRFGRGGPRIGGGPRMLRDSTGNHLGSILRSLALTDTQKTQVRVLMDGHRNCIQEPLQAFRDANQAILDSTNVLRKAIKDSVHSGLLTREEAKDKLHALSESTREAILANPDSAAPMAAMCACKQTLLDDVAALFDETQLSAWNDWVGDLTGFCF